MSSALIVFVAVPADHADALARHLVDRRLAACVSRLPAITSTYRWQGAVETATESLILIKTTAARLEALQAAILEHHPYELPEILAVPVSGGHAPYLDWLARETSDPTE